MNTIVSKSVNGAVAGIAVIVIVTALILGFAYTLRSRSPMESTATCAVPLACSP